MNAETARTLFTILAGIGCLVWIIGVWVSLRVYGAPRMRPIRVPLRRCTAEEARLLALDWGTSEGRSVGEREPTKLVIRPGSGSLTVRFVKDTGGDSAVIETDTSTVRRTMGTISVVLLAGITPGVLLLLIWIMTEIVLPSDKPGVRAQVIQTVQMVHVLWPPFLVAFLYRSMRRATERSAETLAARLELGRGRPQGEA